MASRLLTSAIKGENMIRPPIWLMRQAGRYHSHYQGLRKKYSFETLCKDPRLACEVTLGPIHEFDFDAAILFSDILFILEALGVPLAFDPGPKLGFHLKGIEDLSRFSEAQISKHLNFQKQALLNIRSELPVEKALIGFVGAPLTLYTFAVAGSHKNADGLISMQGGLRDGRYDGFMRILLPALLDNILLQAQAKPDAIALFDSCAGDIDFDDYKNIYLPHLHTLLKRIKRGTNIPLIYYAKAIGQEHWEILKSLPFDVLGVDHHHSLKTAFEIMGEAKAIQGNLDPHVLTLSPEECSEKIDSFLLEVQNLPHTFRQRFICGLGHGVTPQAREENVKMFVDKVKALS